MTKKEKIYVVTQFLVSFTGATWFQMTYNEPGLIINRSIKEMLTILIMSFLLAVTNTGITWLSYLSDPHEPLKIKAPPIPVPPVTIPPVVQQPAIPVKP